ncbi:mercury methylation corrinoid protein HgcA [Paludibacter sp.]|uniref:mercury methylation corrinoid protein HgcA n=1 Tax=Paludibacter sp. TaxID=1898105 RepID=UPI001352BC11|nr:mercury methylation corrinoid protein HgcA [Paludibacter sp.]MTK53180.1 acetyl-CoA synthase subunit gamma [Paludibacter sp.]
MSIAASVNLKDLGLLTARIPSVSEQLTLVDKLGALKVRFGIGRNEYKVTPGLYKVGNPDSQSDVLLSANYKLSFDMLRKELGGRNLWILVVDTKGVNVWCAAGKGNFGTDVVVRGIKAASLESVVQHRRIIAPQLSASGVAAHKVKELSGFKVTFGPVLAKDIKPFIDAGYKATPEMRRVRFPMKERAKLIPVDFMYEKYKLLAILASVFVIAGLDRTGLLFGKMVSESAFPLITIFSAYVAGIVLTPLFLPWVPFRPFALKGTFGGVLTSLLWIVLLHPALPEAIAIGLISLSVSSFMAMNFTGSSTFTSLSGVQKEMKWAIPIQIGTIASGFLLFILSKLL